MPVCLRSQPFCHASLKFAGYSNLLNGDILKMSNLKLSQPGLFFVYRSQSLLCTLARTKALLTKLKGVLSGLKWY